MISASNPVASSEEEGRRESEKNIIFNRSHVIFIISKFSNPAAHDVPRIQYNSRTNRNADIQNTAISKNVDTEYSVFQDRNAF